MKAHRTYLNSKDNKFAWFLEEKKAAKSHKCWWCGEEIIKNEIYMNEIKPVDGRSYPISKKFHYRCSKFYWNNYWIIKTGKIKKYRNYI